MHALRWTAVFALSGAMLWGCGGDGTSATGNVASGGNGGSGNGGSGGNGGGSGARCQVETPTEAGVVALDSGLVQGQKESSSWVFRGIPYAAPPVGDLRWKPPAEAACWEGTKPAYAFGDACPQINSSKQVEGNEDCLTLNVWAPESTEPLPVLFFIHGGGNIQGSSSETIANGKAIYDGIDLAEAGKAIVVTINYRLGPFGFLAIPELSAESEWKASGNYGLLDQIKALEWVQKNIAGFGGDPSRVMVFGESAGALDTITLVASPLAKGLFSAALAQSGGAVSTPLQTAESTMGARVDASSCGNAADRLACLRGKTINELLDELPGSIGIGGTSIAGAAGNYGAVIDGHVLKKSTMETFAAGEHNHVPFVIGTNAEELAAMMAITVNTAAEYEAAINLAFGAVAVDVLAAYPVADYATPQDALVAVYSDMRFTCPARQIATAVSKTQTEPVYRYFFTRRAKTAQGEKPAQHGIELLYVFHTLTDIPLYNPAPEDLGLSDAMMGYWSRFGAAGDPNGNGAVVWPKYDPQKDSHLVLTSPITSADGVRTAQCDAWEAILTKGL